MIWKTMDKPSPVPTPTPLVVNPGSKIRLQVLGTDSRTGIGKLNIHYITFPKGADGDRALALDRLRGVHQTGS